MISAVSRLAIVIVTISCVIFLTCQIGRAQPANPVSATLRLKWLYDPGFAGELVAARAGLFNEQGLDIEIKPGGFDADPIRLVASGADTIGVSGADSFLLARAKGVPIVAIGAGYLRSAVVYYSLSKSGIRSPQDFIGKRVGYQAGQDTATIYEALLAKLGIARRSMEEVPVRFDFSPLITGEVDVWPGYIATQSYALNKRGIAYNLIEPSSYGIDVLGTVYFVTENTFRNKFDLLRRFMKAVVSGWALTYSNYDKAVPLISSYDPKSLPPDLVRFNLDVQRDYFLPRGMRFCEYVEAQWSDLQGILLEQGLLQAPLDLAKTVDYSSLRSVYR
jgi:NitT/TauT family transport system substrate-binding protein